MEGLSLDLPLLLQTIHNILVTPADLMRETLYTTKASDSVRLAKYNVILPWLCSICDQVWAVGHGEQQERPCASCGHMEEECPQRAWGARGLRRRGVSCGESYRGSPWRESWMVHGGGMGQTSSGWRYGVCVRNCGSAAVLTSKFKTMHKYKVTWNRARTLLRKKLPEMLISSHLTTTIFCPERICLAIMDASRPKRCPLPSITIGLDEKVAISGL